MNKSNAIVFILAVLFYVLILWLGGYEFNTRGPGTVAITVVGIWFGIFVVFMKEILE